ncbi:chemosensory receptor c [Plakobranchus ocellatus]|uniref:Chemosensory receptor c n=1 Tax=Plakobranchus ocellatus TaxID=259542 RepID=A0AAV3ZGR2_9GAST|nr:chemosensory receptor c [Plakobranchus ocellatus]
MRSSMRLKSASFSAGSDRTQKTESSAKPVGQVNTKLDATDIKTGVKKDADKKPPQKELLVIKQALTVVMLQVICTTSGIIVYIFVMIEPRFRMGTEYQNLFFVVYGAVDFSYAINAFFNFFIYLNFNSKFKQCFHSVFTCGEISL